MNERLSPSVRPGRGFSVVGMAIIGGWLALATCARADAQPPIETALPRNFVGEFAWDDDPRPQKVALALNVVRRIDADRLEAVGCGTYDAQGEITSIGIRMRIEVPSLAVEIWEFSPIGRDADSFTTDGSHKGKLTSDLKAIDAEWTTLSTGKKGQLHLRAGPPISCSGDTVELAPGPERKTAPSIQGHPGATQGLMLDEDHPPPEGQWALCDQKRF